MIQAMGNEVELGTISATAGGKHSTTKFAPKLMTNIGLKFGPIIIDVPVTYYFGTTHGLSVGVTLGAVW
jgi:hypothetical protein